jgi:nucleoside-diphosphate kinase
LKKGILVMAFERSFVLLKPDAVARRLMGEILGRFEAKGLKIVGMKMLLVTPVLSKQHYAEHVHKPFYPLLEEFITSGPVVALAVEGPGAIAVIRAMLGSTNGREAPLGTIRGDFGLSRQMNLVHGSDGPEAAARELAIYFKPEEPTSLDPWTSAGDEK